MQHDLKLGYMIGYWGAGPPAGVPDALAEAERLGFDSCWTAEAYGSDALTPLAWWGAQTSRIKLGTSICQISARTPTAMAMAAITLDHLSGGRFILGLGASGPQVAEGWYGDDYRKPLARTREYVEIVRQVLAREAPVEFDGERYQLPLRGGTGFGKPLKSIAHPLRADLPIYLAAEGPKNVALVGRDRRRLAADVLRAARRRLLPRRARRGLRPARTRAAQPDDVRGRVPRARSSSPTTSRPRPTSTGPCSRSTSAAWARARSTSTTTCSGAWATRDEAKHIQDLYLDGKKDEAAAAVPTPARRGRRARSGPKEKIRDDLEKWRESAVTTMIVSGAPEQLANDRRARARMSDV